GAYRPAGTSADPGALGRGEHFGCGAGRAGGGDPCRLADPAYRAGPTLAGTPRCAQARLAGRTGRRRTGRAAADRLVDGGRARLGALGAGRGAVGRAPDWLPVWGVVRAGGVHAI